MLLPPSVKCNICGKDRREDTNHWRSFMVTHDGTRTILVVREGAHIGYTHHTCGDEHASTLFARYLSTGNLDETRAPKESHV